MREPLLLGLDEVLEIHRDQIRRYGGHPGIRDMEMLRSAVAMPSAGFGRTYMHADIYEMAAAYIFHIVRNHPFVDGNKRTGTVAALVFLMMNGVEIHADEEGLEKMVRSVAEGKMTKAEITGFFRRYSRPEKR